jgi:hypothetical protein
MGIPMASRSVETMAARRTVNQNASQFIALFLQSGASPLNVSPLVFLLVIPRRAGETATGEQGSGLRGANEFEELARRILLLGF